MLFYVKHYASNFAISTSVKFRRGGSVMFASQMQAYVFIVASMEDSACQSVMWDPCSQMFEGRWLLNLTLLFFRMHCHIGIHDMSSFLALTGVFNYKKPKLVVPSVEICRVHIRVCVIQRNTWFKTLVVFCMRYGHTGIHSEV